MLKKLLSFTLCLNLMIGPVMAQEGATLDSAFGDMNQNQFTDEELKQAQEFIHKGKENRIVSENCKDGKCDVNNVDKNGSVLGGGIGVAIEQNIGKLYAAIFGAGGMLVSAITGALGSAGGGGAGGMAGSAVGMIGAGGNKDGGLSSYTVLKDKDGNRIKGDAAKSAKESLRADDKTKKDMRKGKEVTGKDANGNEIKTEKQSDYCAKIAIASEVTAAVDQYIKQQKIQKMTIKPGDEQKAAIEMAGMTHRQRKQTSLIQAVGFSSVAACYGVLMFSNGVVVDQMMVVKMAAAATLSTIFYMKSHKHKKAQEELERIAKALPRDGACNPYTDTVCFCAEPTSLAGYPSEFAKVCVASEFGPNATASSKTCLTLTKEGKYIADTACKCKQNNTCFKANLSLLNPKFSLASNLMNQGQTGINAVLSSNFDEGQLNAAYLKNSAFNNRVLKAADSKVKPKAVAAKDKKLAEELAKVLPPNMASQLASTPSGIVPAGLESSMPSVALPEAAQKAMDEAVKKVTYDSGGPGFGSSSSGDEELTLPSIPGMNQGEQGPSTEVISFAEQAVENADISKAPETPIFDIISYRYRQSAWNKFEVKSEAPAATTDAPATAP